MTRRVAICALAAAVTALALAATAVAKGPSEASISGPGGQGPYNFTGSGEHTGTALGYLTDQAGFFPAMFGQEPDPMLAERPSGELGPKYTITYTVPGPDGIDDLVRQDLYPYAAGGPVTYTPPGQPFFEVEETHGGWFQASIGLKDTLVEAGLPAKPPAVAADDGGGGGSALDGAWTLALAAGLAVLALGLGLAATLFARRRPRPAPAP